MAQPDMPDSTSTLQDNVNCGGQTQRNHSDQSWLTEIQRRFDSANKMWHVSKNVCIYRVPKLIMLSKPEAYNPFVVALGPYHHANPEFSRMNSHKMEAVNRMLSRIQTDVTTLISEIEKFDRQTRECYEEPIKLDGKQLSWLLTMDACFILQILRLHDRQNFSLVFNSANAMSYSIWLDIMKLENQIPLFILLALLELEFKSRENAKNELARLVSANWMFNGFPFPNDKASEVIEVKRHMEAQRPPCHLLDLSRMVIKDMLITTSGEWVVAIDSEERGIGSESEGSNGKKNGGIKVKVGDRLLQLSCINTFRPPKMELFSFLHQWSTLSAYSLGQAGIEFRAGKLGFQKKKYGKGILSLPQFVVDGGTETVLRNLMAYEEFQHCSWHPEETITTQIVILLKHLISSERDACILRKSKVIISLGSDQETAHIFKDLPNYHSLYPIRAIEKVKGEAREHYSRRWNVWIRELKEKYFATPWSLISFLAALLALFLTAVQTWYAFKQGRNY